MVFYVQISVITGKEKVSFKMYLLLQKVLYGYFEHEAAPGGAVSSLLDNVGTTRSKKVQS